MKATAIAPSNIAFVKFMGKKDESLRLPTNDSLSMCLSDALTTTTVEFSEKLPEDDIDGTFSESEKKRILQHIDRIRKHAGMTLHVRVATRNTFPKSAGIASSASGFAALTVAASHAAGLSLQEQELTVLARLGSGSAARSIPEGFVLWKTGETTEKSFAYSLYPPSYWDIRDIVVVVSKKEKPIATSDAHRAVRTSPFFPTRLAGMKKTLENIQKALEKKDFDAFGLLAEQEALNMHAVMLTAMPPVCYMLPDTIALLTHVWRWRKTGLPVYATLDAGPTVHLLCQAKDEKDVALRVRSLGIGNDILINKPGSGTRLSQEHLF